MSPAEELAEAISELLDAVAGVLSEAGIETDMELEIPLEPPGATRSRLLNHGRLVMVYHPALSAYPGKPWLCYKAAGRTRPYTQLYVWRHSRGPKPRYTYKERFPLKR